jgi:hypothetical protein
VGVVEKTSLGASRGTNPRARESLPLHKGHYFIAPYHFYCQRILPVSRFYKILLIGGIVRVVIRDIAQQRVLLRGIIPVHGQRSAYQCYKVLRIASFRIEIAVAVRVPLICVRYTFRTPMIPSSAAMRTSAWQRGAR